jgi:hypothetical protein
MNRHTHRTASAAVALIATILFITPAFAAAGAGGGGNGNGGGSGGGNQGSVRVVDAVFGLESLTGNEPHVCTFYLDFSGAPSGESGDWSIVDWPPTGNGTEIANGAYAFPANGSFTTGTFELDAGHYRVEWQAINAQTEKHKTFWVEDCVADEPEEQPEDQPQDQPEEQPEDQDQPAEELNEEPAGEPEDELGEGDVNGAVGEPASEPEDELGEGDVDNVVSEPEDQPEEQPAAEEQPVDEPDTEGAIAPSVGDPIVSVLPDTALPTPAPVILGPAAILVLLCLVAAHLTLLDRGTRVRD